MTEYQKEDLRNIMLYILNRFSGGTDYIKLYKILYFANKEQLAKIGVPIICDNFKAWQFGPVPSFAGSALKYIENGEALPDDMYLFKDFFKVRRNQLVTACQPADEDSISEFTRNIIDSHISTCRNKSAKKLSELSHDGAWKEAYYSKKVSSSQNTIRPYLMAADYGAPDDLIEKVRLYFGRNVNSHNWKMSKQLQHSYQRYMTTLYEISTLPDNWDSEDACRVEEQVTLNCRNLAETRRIHTELIDSVYPTPSGNICIDWQQEDRKLSVEIAARKYAFYYISAKHSSHPENYDSPALDIESNGFEPLYEYIEKYLKS